MDLKALVVDSNDPRSVGAWARRKRWDKLLATFPDVGDMKVLDLGGTPMYWANAPVKPAHVTTVNLNRFDSNELVTAVFGDACDPPATIGSHYDLVISNSLLEHVGGHVPRARLANVIHAKADKHWVQTPYRYFPIEPHWAAPGIQFLPFEARVWATMHWKFGNRYTNDRRTAVRAVNEVELIGLTQMRSYFPDSTIWGERIGGVIKSMVAIAS